MNNLLALALLTIFLALPLVEPKFRKCRSEFKTYTPPAEGRDVGTCTPCEPCPLGQEWDKKVKRTWTRDHGYEGDCYPCKPCAEDYYRVSRSETSCRKCRQACESGFRVTAEECGGNVSGRCGDCFPGYVPAVIQEEISVCEPNEKELKPYITKAQPILRVKPEETARPNPSQPAGETDTLSKVLVPVAGIIIVIVVIAGFIWCRRKPEGPAVGGINSQDRLLPSSLSVDGNNVGYRPDRRGEQPILVPCQEYVEQHIGLIKPDLNQDASVGVDLDGITWTKGNDSQTGDDASSEPEIDGPATTVNVEVHKTEEGAEELNEAATSEPTKLGCSAEGQVNARSEPEGQSIHSLPASVQRARQEQLTVNSRELVLVAANVSGDKVPSFFRALRINQVTYEPELEKWRDSDNKNYKDYVLNVLIAWVKQQGPAAILGRLCNALETFEFNQALDKVYDHIEEREAKQIAIKQDVKPTTELSKSDQEEVHIKIDEKLEMKPELYKPGVVHVEEENIHTQIEKRVRKPNHYKPDVKVEVECTSEVGTMTQDGVRGELEERLSQPHEEKGDSEPLIVETKELEERLSEPDEEKGDSEPLIVETEENVNTNLADQPGQLDVGLGDGQIQKSYESLDLFELLKETDNGAS